MGRKRTVATDRSDTRSEHGMEKEGAAPSRFGG